MDASTAKRAAEIAAEIDAIPPVIAALQNFIDNKWRITGLRVVKSDDPNQSTMQPILPLGVEASAAALDYAIGVYQKKLAELQSELAAL